MFFIDLECIIFVLLEERENGLEILGNNTFEKSQVSYKSNSLLPTKVLNYKLIFKEKFKLSFIIGFYFRGAFLRSMDQ